MYRYTSKWLLKELYVGVCVCMGGGLWYICGVGGGGCGIYVG